MFYLTWATKMTPYAQFTARVTQLNPRIQCLDGVTVDRRALKSIGHMWSHLTTGKGELELRELRRLLLRKYHLLNNVSCWTGEPTEMLELHHWLGRERGDYFWNIAPLEPHWHRGLHGHYPQTCIEWVEPIVYTNTWDIGIWKILQVACENIPWKDLAAIKTAHKAGRTWNEPKGLQRLLNTYRR